MLSRATFSVIIGFTLACNLQAQPSPAVEPILQLDEQFKSASSHLWSATGQSAWDALRAYHKVNKVALEPKSAVADALDDFSWNSATTLPPDTVVFAGEYTKAFADQIRQTLSQKIGKHAADMIGAPPPLGLDPKTELIRHKAAIMVSALVARPKFPSAFQPDTRARPFTNSQGTSIPVLGFGADGALAAKMGSNVIVLRDDLQNSQIVEFILFTGNNDDRQRLVVARDPRISSFQKGIEVIRQARSQPVPPTRELEVQGRRWRYVNTLTTLDQLWMPELKASILCDYGELIGRTYLHENRDNDDLHHWWQIREAQQFTNLRLEHTGALVESVFKLAPDFQSLAGGSPKTAASPKPDEPLPLYPKRLIFNGPFMASLWRADADLPYLACWIDSEAVLRQR